MVQLRLLAFALVIGCSNSVITTSSAEPDELVDGSGGATQTSSAEASGGAVEQPASSRAAQGGTSAASAVKATSAVSAGGSSQVRSSATSSHVGGRSQASSAVGGISATSTASSATASGGTAPATSAASGGTSAATSSTKSRFPSDCPRPEEICEIINGTGQKVCRQMTCNDTPYNYCTEFSICSECPRDPYGPSYLNCDGDHSNGCEYYVGNLDHQSGLRVCPIVIDQTSS